MRSSSSSYWAPGIPRATVERAIQHSLCFSLLHGTQQVGFARVITDRTTFAYLADVYVLEAHRGKGLAKWLVATILQHADLQGLRRFMLATRDAHGLYSQFGFGPVAVAGAIDGNTRPGRVQGGIDNGERRGYARIRFVTTAHEALQRLRDGNRRFVARLSDHATSTQSVRRDRSADRSSSRSRSCSAAPTRACPPRSSSTRDSATCS